MTPDEASAFISKVEALGERHSVKYDGRSMIWRCFGQGRPLVLLHGGHGSWLHWVSNIQNLALTRAVWVPDMPGYGDSEVLAPVAGMDELLAAMMTMLDDIFGENAEMDLAGFSFGGLVAANIAARCDRIRKLALLGPVGHGGTRRQTMKLMNWRLSQNEAELEAIMRHNLAVQMLSDPEKIDGLALAAHIRSCRKTRFHRKAISQNGRLSGVLNQSNVPTLLAWGENDVTSNPAVIVPALTEGYAHRHGKIIRRGGHWVQFECPEEINWLLCELLDRSV